MKRRTFLASALGSAWSSAPLLAAPLPAPAITVYKSEGCGCCEGWITHLQKAGFTVDAHNVPDTAVYRDKFGIPQELASCHTGQVDGYALEGHVPAADIKRLLARRPKARGLAVPSMPLGSPGMEGPRKDPYDVLLVQLDGRHTIYQHYN
jgi:hypothetical protein